MQFIEEFSNKSGLCKFEAFFAFRACKIITDTVVTINYLNETGVAVAITV